MAWPWVLGVIAVIFFARQAWKAWKSPQNQLGQQAARLGWGVAGHVKEEGYINVVYKKGDVQAVVSGKLEMVVLTRPSGPQPFNNFVELEDYLLYVNDSDFLKNIITIIKGFQIDNSHIEESNFICQKIETTLRTNVAQEMLKEMEAKGNYEYELAYRFLMNTIAQELKTGRHHIYRGILSLTGENFLALYKNAHNELYEDGKDQGEMKELKAKIGMVG